MKALTKTQWRYCHFRKLCKDVIPAVIDGQEFYDETQVRPITAPMELAYLRYHRLFLRGRDRTRILRHLYGDAKRTVQFSHINISQHIRGMVCQGVYPGAFTHFINFDIDAHSPDRVEDCIAKHDTIHQVMSRRNLCRWQEVGTRGTHLWAVFSRKMSRAEAEALCRGILQEAQHLRPDLDFKMQDNQRQDDVQESNRIFANLVTTLQSIGFDPGDKDTWHTWERRFERPQAVSTSKSNVFTWEHRPLNEFKGFGASELEIIRAELLPIYGKRTSFEQAVVVTALLLDFVRCWPGEIPVRRFSDVLQAIPQCYLSSTIVINSEKYPFSLALSCPLRRLNKVVSLIDRLISLGWLRVRVKHWCKQGTRGRATGYALGVGIRHCWKQSDHQPPEWCCEELLMEGERLHLL